MSTDSGVPDYRTRGAHVGSHMGQSNSPLRSARLANGLHKIRDFGLYAGTHGHGALLVARTALSTSAAAAVQPLGGENSTATASWAQLLCFLTGRDPDRCRRCGERLEHVPVVPSAGAPPQGLVA